MTNFRQKLKEHDVIASLSIMTLRMSMLAGKFLLALFIVRFIGLEAMGIYGLVSATAAIIQMVMRFGIFSSLSRQAVNQSREELAHNLRHYGSGCAILYSIALPFTLIAGWYYDKMELMILSFLIVLFEHISFDIFTLVNNLQKPKLANIILTMQSASWIYLFMIIAFFIPSLRTLDDVFIFWIAGSVVSAAVTLYLARNWPWRHAFATRLSIGWYKTHVKKAWKLYVGEIVSTMIIYVDRYIITIFLSLELVGIYTLFWQVINAICNLVGAGVLQVYRPRLIAAFQEQNREKFKKLFHESLYKSFGGTLALAIASGIIVPFLITYTKQPMAVEYLPLLWLMLATSFFRVGSDAFGNAIYAQHQDNMIVQSVFLRLFVATIVGVVALHFLGIYGVIVNAAVTGGTAIAFTVIAWKYKERK